MQEYDAQQWLERQRQGQESTYRLLAQLWRTRRDDDRDRLADERAWLRLAGGLREE